MHISPHPAFKVVQLSHLEELKSELVELEHERSGARILHIANDDPENLFCLSFQTIPTSSNGVAHILEHTVLCGSKKFPIKDPFFAMMRRSLNTFMNALTGADFTCYPAATQVEADFYNLFEVYLDAVFHPQLKRESFLQEGHRLELVDPQDPKSDLVYKGIVFNEMKGALASPDSRVWHALAQALVPDLTYAHISGGDPVDIPSLTYEQLIEFHKTHYHPSRCLFFFYGNLPLKRHLQTLDEMILKKTEKLPPLPKLPTQRRFEAPRYIESCYPLADAGEEQAIIAWGFLTVAASDQEKLLALALLDAILMETDASPLKLALLRSGLCRTADAFIDLEMSEVPYVIVCKGCRAEDADKLEAVLLSTLEELEKNGIAPHLIESALHQLEMAKTEIGGDQHTPFGLTLFLRSALTLQHGGRADIALKIHSLFAVLRKNLENPRFLTTLLHEMLSSNRHRARLVSKPDASLLEKEEKEERERLNQLAQKLTEDERKKLASTMRHLAHFQQEMEHQNLECLPKVTLKDVPVLAQHFALKEEKSLFSHTTFTNGFIYAELIMDLPYLTLEELPWATLFVSLLSEVGVGKRSYVEQLEMLQAHVGGLAASLYLNPLIDDPSTVRPTLVLRSKALERNGNAMLKIMKEWALFARFDEKERIAELIQQTCVSLEQRLTKNALRYASSEALATLSPAAFLTEKLQGLSYFQWMLKVPHTPHILEIMKEKLLSFHNPRLVLTCSEKALQTLDTDTLLDLPKRPFTPFHLPITLPAPAFHARPIAMPVAFTCQAVKLASYLNPHAPALALASHLMDHLVLHPKIREQGGAYGAGTTYVPTLGHFTFHTFRDPHLNASLEAFHEAADTIANKKFTPADLEAAKLEAAQALDAPVAPGGRGSIAYACEQSHLSQERRQAFRDHLLALSPEEVALATQKELLPRLETSSLVTFASQDLIEKENLSRQNRLPIIPI